MYFSVGLQAIDVPTHDQLRFFTKHYGWEHIQASVLTDLLDSALPDLKNPTEWIILCACIIHVSLN